MGERLQMAKSTRRKQKPAKFYSIHIRINTTIANTLEKVSEAYDAESAAAKKELMAMLQNIEKMK